MTMLIGYRHLRRFFEGFEWWKLEPRPDVLRLPPPPERTAPASKPDAAPPLPVLHDSPVCLAEPGRRYVIYLPQGGAVTADLAPGRYQARWFNPRSGEWLKEPFPAAGGEWTEALVLATAALPPTGQPGSGSRPGSESLPCRHVRGWHHSAFRHSRHRGITMSR